MDKETLKNYRENHKTAFLVEQYDVLVALIHYQALKLDEEDSDSDESDSSSD